MVRVVIIGTGNHAHGLSHLYSIHNTNGLNFVEVTKKTVRQQDVGQFFHMTDVFIVDFEDAIQRADIIILAIPAVAVKTFIGENYHKLEGKIIVDATNQRTGMCRTVGEDFFSYFSMTSRGTHGTGSSRGWTEKTILCVRGLNDISAVEALRQQPYSKQKLCTKLCCEDRSTLQIVQDFVESSLGLQVKVIPFERYSHEEYTNQQNSIGKEWMEALVIILFIFVWCITYSILQYSVMQGEPWHHFPLFIMNKGISWTSIYGFALIKVPGIWVHVHDTWTQDTLVDKPPLLLRWLNLRKHLGLISLWLLSVHIFMTCLLLSIGYYGQLYQNPNNPMSRLNANGEASFLFGIVGAALYFIVGISSLPSVLESMTLRQHQFLHGDIAWIALSFGIVHVMCQGIQVTWNHTEQWPGGLPPITLMSSCFPLVVILLKILQVLYCQLKNYCCPKDYSRHYHRYHRRSRQQQQQLLRSGNDGVSADGHHGGGESLVSGSVVGTRVGDRGRKKNSKTNDNGGPYRRNPSSSRNTASPSGSSDDEEDVEHLAVVVVDNNNIESVSDVQSDLLDTSTKTSI